MQNKTNIFCNRSKIEFNLYSILNTFILEKVDLILMHFFNIVVFKKIIYVYV